MAKLNTRLHPKLTESAISNLQSKKIHTVFDFVPEDSEKLMQYSGLSYQEVLDLKQEISKLYIGGIKSGLELLKTSNNNVIRTEIESLDRLLNGGLSRGEIYELCGLSSSGKTQLCHTIAVNVARHLDGYVHYIDTNGDFCGTRAQLIMENGSECDEELHQGLVLDRIRVTRVESTQELLNFLHSLKPLSIKSSCDDVYAPIKVVIIDSLPAVFFNDDANSLQSSYTCVLNNFANIIRCIASKLNVVFMTVNLISEWRQNNGLGLTAMAKMPVERKPMLGKYWLSIPNTRLFVESMDSEDRKITVWKSSHLRSGSTCYVRVTNTGVASIESA